MIRLQSCFGPVLEELMSIRGDEYRIRKFSFFHFGEIDYLDIYFLGLKFQYGIDFQVELNIARNCYEYCHHQYEQLHDDDQLYYEKIQSPTSGTSLLDYFLLNNSLYSHTSFYDDRDADDFGGNRFAADQLSLLSAASLKFQQKWCLPYLDEISEFENHELNHDSHAVYIENFNHLLKISKTNQFK
jgi:hypothetical protein